MTSGPVDSSSVERHIQDMSSYTDVLIIGAGPAGLMAAQALARLGVDTRIVDRREIGAQYGNADGIQPRTLEIWESYGMRSTLMAQGASPVHGMITYEKDESGSGLVRSTPSKNVVVDCRYPFEVAAHINTIEGTLRSSMEKAGVTVDQPVAPVSIELMDADTTSTHSIKVVLQRLSPSSTKSANGNTEYTETIFAKYVIGADGAYSWVRRNFGIEMQGEQTEYVWGVTDVTLDTNFPDCRFKCVIQSSKGAIIIIPREEDKVRMYVQLGPQDSVKTSDGRLDKSVLSSDMMRTKVLTRIREGMHPYKIEFTRVFWSTIFTVPQKVAASYSYKDRIFIVGDACHTHSPKAGQGANASMGDSHNLAWKLAYVLRGLANPSLLATYETERRNFAQDLIAFDKRIAHSLDGKTAEEYREMLHDQNLFTSGIGICYQSRLSLPTQYPLSSLRVGERLPSGPLIRLGDWDTVDLQDLAPSDGTFKVIIVASMTEHSGVLASFTTELISQILHPEMIRYSTILTDRKESVQWMDVPEALRSWKRIFVSEDASWIATGWVVLVRPDGYISMIEGLESASAQKISTFLSQL